MPPAQWALQNDRPVIHIALSLTSGGPNVVRGLVADSGAGTRQSTFQMVLTKGDCLNCGGILMGQVRLGGAYTGSFPLYLVEIQIPQLNFREPVPIVGVAQVPQGYDGIAGFKFLNRFHFGNFGNPDRFGLDLLRP